MALLVGAELVLATRSQVPEFMLSEEQNKKLAEASANVMRHYPQIMLSEKQQDIVTLIYAVGKIGLEQRGAFVDRKKREAAEKQSTVASFHRAEN